MKRASHWWFKFAVCVYGRERGGDVGLDMDECTAA